MPSNNSFKQALVTGATSGLGEALSYFLEEKGIPVMRTGSKEINLADPSQRKKLLATIEEKKPDLIVNSAGLGFYGPSTKLPIDEQLVIMEVNCNALVEITLHAAKTLLEGGMRGTILNISSAGAFFPFPTYSVYCASKAFVNNFSLALDAELKDQGIRVLCACPGQIDTNFRYRAARGRPQKPDRRSMSAERAVQYLWKQILNEKPLSIFGWRTKVVVWIARLLPRALLNKILSRSISERY